jgi:hypothetical protein
MNAARAFFTSDLPYIYIFICNFSGFCNFDIHHTQTFTDKPYIVIFKGADFIPERAFRALGVFQVADIKTRKRRFYSAAADVEIKDILKYQINDNGSAL